MSKAPSFKVAEISIATGLPDHALKDIVRLNCAPPSQDVRRGVSRHFDTNGLATFAIAGALYRAGAEPLPSAVIALGLATEWLQQSAAKYELAYVYDNLDQMANDASSQSRRKVSIETSVLRGDRYTLHRKLAKLDLEYRPERERPGDFKIEIISRRFVWDVSSGQPEPLFTIEGWRRGAQKIILQSFFDDHCSGKPELIAATKSAWSADRDTADARIVLNASQAVRRAFNRISQHRELTSEGELIED
jgi:hypothetical protein